MPKYPAIITGREYDDEIDSYSHLVSAPGPYLEFGEFLSLEATSTDASATVRFSGKFLSTDNEIRSFTEDMVITGTGNQTAVTSRIGPCWLLGFSVRVVAGTITDGEIVASVHVARASASNPVHVMTLASGEVTNTRALGLGAYLAQGSSSSTPTQPTIATATASPAAGADFTITVTASQVWEIQALYFSLTASAAAANRHVHVQITDGANLAWKMDAGSYVTASQTRAFNWGPIGAQFTGVGGLAFVMAAPPMMLGAGYTVGTSTGAIQAGDQYSLIRLLYRQH